MIASKYTHEEFVTRMRNFASAYAHRKTFSDKVLKNKGRRKKQGELSDSFDRLCVSARAYVDGKVNSAE